MGSKQVQQVRGLSRVVGRRGIIAACAAAATAIADRFANQGTAQAADNDPLRIGTTNLGTAQTTLARTSGGAGVALYSVDTNGTGANFGIRGEATGAGVGVFGVSDSGIGIKGASNTGPGAFLDSNTSTGFQGRSVSGIGVIGSTNNNVLLSTGQAPLGAFAAQFVGGHGVFIDGDLQVTGMKSAAVPHRDGSLRRVYCMESPEAFFEDFGEAHLVGGAVQIAIDTDFASIVRTDNYHVFLTPYGDSNGLYVANRTPRGFEVREQGGGNSSTQFSYRIVATRGDKAQTRLTRTTPPPNPKTPPPPNFSGDESTRRIRGR